MKTRLLVPVVALLLMASAAPAQQKGAPSKAAPSKVDYSGFVRLTGEVAQYRKERLIDLETFRRMAAEKGVVVLDTRSEAAYQRKHIKGAVNLNFSELTEGKLARVIPSRETKILIYCNNNFEGDLRNFAPKRAALALNIPTFVNLYGYGYKNLYELSETIPVDHPKLVFEGTDVFRRINYR